MKRHFKFLRNQIEPMPLYNRSHGHNKSKDGRDIALSTHKKQLFLEKEIKADDTLQSIALEFNVSVFATTNQIRSIMLAITPLEKIKTSYLVGRQPNEHLIRCSLPEDAEDGGKTTGLSSNNVSELKRINNIHKDNEIYARKVIKVPSNPFSLLLEKEYFLESGNPPEKTCIIKLQTPPEICDVIVETVNNSSCIPKNSNESSEDKSSFSQPPDEVHESLSLLSTTVEAKPNDVISCNGADWGISWPALILVTLVLGIGGPVLYIFWFLWVRNEKAEGS